MEFAFKSIENLFESIETKRSELIEEIEASDNYFKDRIDTNEKTIENNLNRARKILLDKLKLNLAHLLANVIKLDLEYAQFKPSFQILEESILYNYDEINPNSSLTKLSNFLKFRDLNRLRLNEIAFTDPHHRFQVNFISILSVKKIFIDLNIIQDGEVQIQKRKLLILNGHGTKLYELDYFDRMNEEDVSNRVTFFAKNRIYIFNTMDTNLDMYQVEIFNFKLELLKTVQLCKDVRHLVKNNYELCIQTTKQLRFYDFDLEFKYVQGQKDNEKEFFYIAKFRLIHFDESTFYMFSSEQNQLRLISRKSGEILSNTTLSCMLFQHLSLFDLKNDQILFISKSFKNNKPAEQKAIIVNSRGEILDEKKMKYFIADLSRTVYDTIIVNKGIFYNNDNNTQTIKFKTI